MSVDPQLACTNFVTSDEVFESACACDLNEDDHGDLVEQYAADVSDALYILSGGRITGRCRRVVWPFRVGVLCGVAGRIGRIWGDSFGDPAFGRMDWVGYDSIDSIPLAGPETAINEVTIDGIALDPSEYGLLDGYQLFRKSGWWPDGNDITKDESEDGTFTIDFSFGRVPNLTTKRAAIELICQMTKSDSQTLNRIRGIVSANVQGVSVAMEKDEISQGLPEVARFMDLYGNSGARGPYGVWTPELDHGWRLLSVSSGVASS